MDPNANLREQLAIAKRILESPGYSEVHEYVVDAERLAELVVALDEWIRKGGFLPDSWRKDD
jgi:hypothetical protein